MKQLEMLYEGKAKQVFLTDDPDKIVIRYKDADNLEHTIHVATMDQANTQPIIGMAQEGGVTYWTTTSGGKTSFVLDTDKLKTAKSDMIILHPLPRVNEIARAVDNDLRAVYFRQVENGKFVRMALILTLLRWADGNKPFERTPVFGEPYLVNELRCANRRCISATEDVDQLFRRGEDGICRCAYCEAKAPSDCR